MSYQVLARKWRPKTFREMVGQEHVLKALINALDHNRLHHAYLFTGTRGVGKTTIARILAKCLNCHVGVSSVPCGQCSACTEINEGRFVDLLEVDAASRTKVEDTRELLDNVQYAPTAGRYKVYLIDEVHMLSAHSFNALLKTLEEPPPHVKFLLATTDPQKLPATILSRCLQFNLKNMTPERIVGHLDHVLKEEMVEFDEQSLWLLGRSADGSMRDAMSLCDQAIAYGSGKLSEVDVRNMLGTIDHTAIYEIIDALLQLDGSTLLAAVAKLSEHAPDYIGALEELLTLLHRIAIAQAVPAAVDNSFGDAQRISELATKVSAEDVQLFYQMGLAGRRDLPLAPDPRSGFEMILLRMLAFKPAGVPQMPTVALSSQGQQQTPAIESPQAAQNSNLNSHSNSEPAIQSPSEPTEFAPVKKPKPTETTAEAVESAAVATNATISSAPVKSETSSQQQPFESPTKIAPADSELTDVNELEVKPCVHTEPTKQESTSTRSNELFEQSPLSAKSEPIVSLEASSLSELSPESWAGLYEQFGFGGVVGNIASHCILTHCQGDKLEMTLEAGNATLFNDTYTARIQEHMSVVLNRPVQLTIVVGETDRETPAQRRARITAEQKQQAVVNLQDDPNVKVLFEQFGATLDLESVKPLSINK